MIIAKNSKDLVLLPEMSNRHGLIAGSTGSGKTVTIQVMAENFSRIGVPVFMADIKGDLTGIGYPGEMTTKLSDRIKSMKIANFSFEGNPVRYWDVYEEEGDRIKTTVHRLGPNLLGRLLNLSEAQFGSLYQVFKIANDYDITIRNLKDVYDVINVILEFSDTLEKSYGRIAKTSFTTLQRSLLFLEDGGNDILFSEDNNSFDIREFLSIEDGRGVINILKASRLIKSPQVYATFLLWLMAELFEVLPERGDAEKPLMCFFFDEAHLIFDNAPSIIIDRVEKLVKLIRSKGVGIYFITQNPSDIPDGVLSQLGNRVQHSIRAFTPKDQKSLRSIAQSFRPNSKFNVEDVISTLKIGEALVSFLDVDGSPTVVNRALIYPPRSKIGCALQTIKEISYE